MEEAGEDEDDAEGQEFGSKTVVIHPGSQNLRIGLASDALPKTVPMVLARRWKNCEAEDENGEPSPKRAKLDEDSFEAAETLFGEEVGVPTLFITDLC
jgi:actin-related protein 8